MNFFPPPSPRGQPEEEPFVPDMSEGAETGLYLALLELLDEGLIITGDETILEVNSAACRLLKRDYRQLAGRPLAEIFPTERAFLNARARLFIQGEMRGSLQLSLPGGGHRSLRFVAAARIRPGIHALILSPDVYAEAAPETTAPQQSGDTVWPRLAAALDQAVIVSDAQGRVAAANAAAIAELGVPREQLVGHALENVVSVDWPAEGEPPRASLITRDERELQARILPGPQPGWRLLVLPASVRSVSPPVPRIAVADERFRLAFSSSPLPSLLCDTEGEHILAANAAAARFYGYAESDFTTLRLNALRTEHPASADSIPTPPECGVWELQRADASRFSAEVLVFPLQTHDGTEVLALIHDLPEQPLLSSRLRVPTGTFDAFGQALLITDADNRILAVNQAFTELTGYTREDAVGHTPELLNSGHHEADFFRTLWEQLNSTGQWQGQMWNRLKDGEIQPQWVALRTVRNTEGKPLHYIGMFSELTRQSAQRAVPVSTSPGTEEAQTRPSTTAQAKNPAPAARSALQDLAAAWQLLQEQSAQRIGLAWLRFEHWHELARTLGSDRADAFIDALQRRLSSLLPTQACIARPEEAALAMVFPLSSLNEAGTLVESWLSSLHTPVQLQLAEPPIHVHASLGLALCPEDGGRFEVVLDHARLACPPAILTPEIDNESAPAWQGKNARAHTRWQAHHPGLAQAGLERRLLTATLGRALAEDRLSLRFAPIQELGTGGAPANLCGALAIAVIAHEDLGLLPAESLLPCEPGAEHQAQQQAIAEFTFRTAIAQVGQWPDDAHLALPCPPALFEHAEFARELSHLLAHHDLAPQRLELLLDVAALNRITPLAAANLRSLATEGVALSLRELDRGSLPLSMLASWPLRNLWLNEARLPASVDAQAGQERLSAALIALAQALQLGVVARCSEDATGHGLLRAQGAGQICLDSHRQLLDETQIVQQLCN